MLQRIYSLLLATTLTFLVTQCEKAPSTGTSGNESVVLATVAGLPITEDDLLEEAAWKAANRQSVQSASTLLDDMVKRRALLAKARSQGFEEEPATRRRMESILIARLREQELEQAVANAQVSEEELRSAYKARTAQISRKGMDRFATLFLEASDKSSAEHRAEVRSRLEEGIERSDAAPAPGGRGPAATGFGAAAVEYSDDQISRYKGGDVGWIESGASSSRIPDSVLAAGRLLSKGDRSGILETPDGFYVIMKTDSRPGGMPSFEEVSPRLHHELLIEKRRSIEAEFMADVIKAADVSLDSVAVEQIKLPTSRPTKSSPELPVGPEAGPKPSASR